MSIITNRAWIPLDQHGRLQQREDLKPEKCMGESNKEAFLNTVSSMVRGKKSHPAFERYDEVFRDQQTLFLYSAIEDVKREQMEEDGSLIDAIDKKVEEERLQKMYVKCKECGELV